MRPSACAGESGSRRMWLPVRTGESGFMFLESNFFQAAAPENRTTGNAISVLGQRRVDLIGPGEDPAGEVLHVGITLISEELCDALAAAAGRGLHNELDIALDPGKPPRRFVHGNECAADARPLALVGLADIEDHKTV